MARVKVPILVTDLQGNAKSGASVTITERANGGHVPLWTQETGGSLEFSPKPTNASGQLDYWVEEGRYKARVSASGFETYDEPFDAVSAGRVPLYTGTVPNMTGIENGTEIVFSPAAGVLWRLRANRDSTSTYQWEFVGGPPWHIDTGGSSVAVTTSASVYTPVALSSPQLTIPLAGDWEIEWSGTGSPDSVPSSDWRIGARYGAGLGSPITVASGGPMMSSYVAGARASFAYKRRINGITASSALRLYAIANAASVALTLWDVSLGITPVRVT